MPGATTNASGVVPAPVRCGIYARVSTKDGRQDTENQLIQLREYAARQGWTVVETYIDHESAKTGDRTGFRRLFEDASRRAFDIVLVWALDRFTREGVLETFTYVERLRGLGASFESFTEAQFRTTGPAGELMLAIAAWIAKQERLRISERTKAGVERARRSGKHCGRPRRVFRRDEIARLRDVEGLSWRSIAERLGAPVSTVVDAYRCTESLASTGQGPTLETLPSSLAPAAFG